MTALAWLNDLVQWLGRWVPRLVLIEPTHRGVRFGPRGGAHAVGPGLVVYWPITHSLVQIPVTTQSIQLSAQILHAEQSDAAFVPRVMLCGAAIQFRVDRVVDFATKALHAQALIDNRAQAAIARHASKSSDRAQWAAAVLTDLRLELQPFGVSLERMDFTQNGTGVALKNVADWNYTDNTAGKRPD